MLPEEINQLVGKIETEILEFISYIKSLEKDFRKTSSKLTENKPFQQRQSFHDDENLPDSGALVDAFNIVRNVLLRISNLIDEFACLPTEDEQNFKQSDAHIVKYYYCQYVYQIASYLVKTVEEHLSNFSEKLNDLASTPTLSSDKEEKVEPEKQRNAPVGFRSKPPREMLPRYFKFNLFKPATVCTEDGTEYPPLKTVYNGEYNSSVENFSSASEEFASEELGESSEGSYCGNRSQGYKMENIKTSKAIDHLASSVYDLCEAFNRLCAHLQKNTFSRYTQTPLALHFKDFVPTGSPICRHTLNDSLNVDDYLRNRIKNYICCSRKCSKCCFSCRNKHEESDFRTRREDRSRRRSFAGRYHPILDAEPAWMQKNPAKYNKKKKSPDSDLDEVTVKKDSNIPPQTKGRMDVYSIGKRIEENLKDTRNRIHKALNKTKRLSQEFIKEPENKKDFSECHPTYVEKLKEKLDDYCIPLSNASKKLSRGELKPLRKKNQEQKNEKSVGTKSRMTTLMSVNRQFSPGMTENQSPKDCTMAEESENKTVDTATEEIESELEKFGKVYLENSSKPIFLKDLKEKIWTKFSENFGGFCLLPLSSKDCPGMEVLTKMSQSDVLKDPQEISFSKMQSLINKIEADDQEYPRVLTFDFCKFSKTIKDKFTDHFKKDSKISEKEEMKSILDVLVHSFQAAVDFFEETGESNIIVPEKVKSEIKTIVPDVLEKKKTGEDDIQKHYEKDIDALVKEIIDTAMKTVTDDRKPGKEKVKKSHSSETSQNFHESVKKNSEKVLSCKTSPNVCESVKKNSKKVLSSETCPNLCEKKAKCRAIIHACEVCDSMADPVICLCKESNQDCEDDCLVMKSFKRSCLTCWNGRERGLTIHQCHDSIPSGVLEIRHMDINGKICVCYLFWNRKKETDDWRWNKSPFRDPTRVELEQETSDLKDVVFKVIYGAEGHLLKESLAETQLQVVEDYSEALSSKKNKTLSHEGIQSYSLSYLYKIKRADTDKSAPKIKRHDHPYLSKAKQRMLTKLARFFDDVQRVGYGAGPPLLLKLRNKSALYDSYDLLMAPSRIRLSYYRSLRVIIVEDCTTKVAPSESNFIDEDQSGELFEIFKHKLYYSPRKRIFVHPSEETQCLYFNPDTDTHPQWFTFAGAVLALAILHQKKLDVKLPLCLFKCLLDRPLGIYDLKEIDPLFYQKLMWIKENDITNRKEKLTFTIKDVVDNRTYENELMMNGTNIAVTEKNKYRYIDLAVKWKIAERCLSQMKDFRRGFAEVLDPGFLTSFSEKEILSLIQNPPNSQIFIDEATSWKKSSKDVRRESW